MSERISNPVAHLDKLEPRRSPQQRESAKEQARIQRRVARFEAQRAQEEAMDIRMHDLNPGVEHQRKAAFIPKKQSLDGRAAPPAAATATPRVPERQAKLSRMMNPMEGPADTPDAFALELERELAATPDEPAKPAPSADAAGDDTDVEAILKRFKGSPEEIARQVAKSYGHAEKRMRQKEHELNLLMTQSGTPSPAAAPTPQGNAQIQVVPQFDYKTWGDKLLDSPADRAKELAEHVAASVKNEMTRDLIAPLYDEAIENRLFRKFPEVVTEENLDVLKAMAYKESGANRWEKMVNAVAKYKAAMPMTKVIGNPDVEQMQQAVQQPTPQARQASGKKMYKQSELQELMQRKMRTGEWQRDARWSTLVNQAYADGRVLRGQ